MEYVKSYLPEGTEIQVPTWALEDPKLMEADIGKFGRMWLNYMEENYQVELQKMMLKGVQMETVLQVNEEAYEMKEKLMEQQKQHEKVEQMDFWSKVQRVKMIEIEVERQVVEEIVLKPRTI